MTGATRRTGGGGGAWAGVAAALLALAVAGCGAQRLARLPAPAVDLSGRWVLDPAASDDPRAAIAAAIPKPRRDRRDDTLPRAAPDVQEQRGPHGERRQGGRGRGGGDSSTTPAEEPVPAWGVHDPAAFVRAFVLPAPRLDIAQEPSLVRLAQGERRRAFEPGDEEPLNVTDRLGSRAVRAGWDGDAFVVASENSTRLHVVERLRRVGDDGLEQRIEFKAPGVKTLNVRSVYRRASAAELAAPPPEGPPAPDLR